MTVFNWMCALFPFALFCFIAVIFTNKRFSPKLNGTIWGIVIAVVGALHVFVFVSDPKSSFLLSLMPVTAYLPVAITFFILSGSNRISKFFSVLFAALCSVSADLIYLFMLRISVMWGKSIPHFYSIVSLFACAFAVGIIGFIVFRFLRKVFAQRDVIPNKLWYITPALFFLLLWSFWQKGSVTDIFMTIMVLLLDISVFCMITALISSHEHQKRIAGEMAAIEKQLETEREEYESMRRTVELGRQYRHDMRHHFSVIQGMLQEGGNSRVKEYLVGLNGRLDQTEKTEYCKNATINALLSVYGERARSNSITFDAHISLPEVPFVDEIDLCSVISNAVDNAVNACMKLRGGEKKIEIVTEYTDGRLSVTVKNPIEHEPVLDAEGFPVFEKTEGHGYGLLSMQHIARKYGGIIKILVDGGMFTLVAVMFRKPSGAAKKEQRGQTVLRSLAEGSACLLAGILLLNCMPSTGNVLEQTPPISKASESEINVLDALEQTPPIGKESESEMHVPDASEQTPLSGKASEPETHDYGWKWGDSEIRISEPKINVPDAEEIINGYVEECKALFHSYYLRKYNGYVAAEFSSEEIASDDEIYVLRMSYLLQAGSSAEYFRYFTVDKSTGKILELSDLFRSGSDYELGLVNEILRQMEKGVSENGDFYFGFGIWDDEPGLSELNDPNFYLDQNHALVIVFDESEVAPGNMGSPSFTIEYAAIESILAENSLIKEGT